MASFTITAPTGESFNIVGDSPPTEQELEAIYAGLPKTPTASSSASPIAEQEAFKQQFIREGTQTMPQQVLGALTAPVRVGVDLAKGIGGLALRGAQGLGSMAQKSSNDYQQAFGQEGFLNRLRAIIGEQAGQTADVLQTAGEVGPRMVAEGVEGIRQALQNPDTFRTVTSLSNPLAALIQAAVTPKSAPTQAEAQRAFENQIVNEAVSQEFERPILQSAQEAVGLPTLAETNIDVARATPLVLGAEALPRAIANTARSVVAPIQRVISRSLPATVEQSAMAALDITAEEAARHIPIVNQRVLEIAPKGGIPKTTAQALKLADTAEASLYQDALAADKLATQQGLAPRADLIISRVEETLNNIPTLLPEERVALLNDARSRYADVSTPAKGRDLQQRLNKEFEAQYANDTFDRAAPANEVKLAVRNSIAEQMDEINKAVTGLDSSPYSDIGSLIEFKGNLKKTSQNIERAEARQKTGIGASRSTRIPRGKVEAIYQAKKSLLSPFQRTQLEALDSNVAKIFRQGERAGEAAALDPNVQQSLIQKYSAQKTPPPLPEAPVAAPSAADLQLQKIIDRLPASERGANERAVAEAILRSRRRRAP